MTDVCIVGIGIHPFGRTDGLSGLDQGVFAVRQALGDAGVEWRDVQFAYGGSDAAGNPDTMVERLGEVRGAGWEKRAEESWHRDLLPRAS